MATDMETLELESRLMRARMERLEEENLKLLAENAAILTAAEKAGFKLSPCQRHAYEIGEM
jgi:uncharacterized protein (UPF0335 family)